MTKENTARNNDFFPLSIYSTQSDLVEERSQSLYRETFIG
jgi:hypothetical protein